MTTKAQQKATKKYIAKSYDRSLVYLPKGMKEEIKEHVKETGESLNAFYVRAVKETMERDKQGSSK